MTSKAVAFWQLVLTDLSRPLIDPIAFCTDPVVILTGSHWALSLTLRYWLCVLRPPYITQLAPLDIQTYAEMVKKAQLLEDATDFIDYIKGKFMKKELTPGMASAKPNIRNKRPFNITEGPSQERKPKILVPNTPVKSNCKHCDKPSHTADECWRKVGTCLRCGSREHHIPECLSEEVLRSTGNAWALLVLHFFHRHMKKLMAFLKDYEASSGSPKKHWVSWNIIAQPKECGGLGILNIQDMQIALRTKLLWKVISGTSLWGDFLKAKYLHNIHYSKASYDLMHAADSRLWRHVSSIVASNHRVLVANLDSAASFWFDVWTGSVPLHKFIPDNVWQNIQGKYLSIKDVFHEPGGVHLLLARHFCPAIILNNCIAVVGDSDKWIWCPTPDGTFTSSSVRKINQPIICVGWDKIWCLAAPLKWSILVWRLAKGCVPTDDILAGCGIPLCSRCSCCSSPSIESGTHLFFHSKVAKAVWGSLFDVLKFHNLSVLNPMHGVIFFLDAQPATSSRGNLIRFIFLAVIWELWCSRNRSRYDSFAMNNTHVLSKIRLNVQDAVSASVLVFKGLASAQIRLLSQCGIHVQQSPNLIPKVVRWLLPPTGRLKLNVDGAYKSSMGIAAGGGVHRNDRGDIIFCFAHRYPHVCSSLEAEALALRDGIYMCCNHGFNTIFIESDSMVLIQVIKGREANQVADALVNLGCSSLPVCNLWFSWADLPPAVKGPCHLDKAGLPSIRP
ncbi:hypothetical protein Taro_030114 [Colocasia esculenta]|uniref:RNase H type-1 domain-containing protein n=1 Tax=Colocasia esculenta TaxID=4460 RepID=A0A843VFI4_COLES|nr:hypothetical protein [Colocasia esculenta]